jgi:RNA polymerase sigma factor (sigma-70 family)
MKPPEPQEATPGARAALGPPNPHNAELQQLLGRIALGDRAAFARLYTLVRGQLFATVLRINSDRAQAEELLQDVFVKIWHGARSYDMGRNQAMAWLASVARYRAIDSLRERASAPVHTSLTLLTPDGEALDLLDAMPSERPSPAELHEQRQEHAELHRCMHELSAEQRQCVTLAYVQGLTHAEVASHLALPLGSVKSWVRRGLMALQKCMGAHFGRSVGG